MPTYAYASTLMPFKQKRCKTEAVSSESIDNQQAFEMVGNAHPTLPPPDCRLPKNYYPLPNTYCLINTRLRIPGLWFSRGS